MDRQEWREHLHQQIKQYMPALMQFITLSGKRLEDITGMSYSPEIVPRQHNYLAALHGDEEESAYIRSQFQEYLHTGYVNVQVTFADESVLKERIYEPMLDSRMRPKKQWGVLYPKEGESD